MSSSSEPEKSAAGPSGDPPATDNTKTAQDPPSTSSSSSSWFDSTLNTVKKTAIGQYEHFKSANPDLAKTIEGTVQDVASKVDDLQVQQKEKSAKAELDKVMSKLEVDYQNVQKAAWDDYNKYWPLSSSSTKDGAAVDDVQKAQQAIKVAVEAAQASIAQAKKDAIVSLHQAMEAAATAREAKLQAEYNKALNAARAHFDGLKKVGGAATEKTATKVESGIANAQTKLATAKSKAISQYENALQDVQKNLKTVEGQIADMIKAMEAKLVDESSGDVSKDAQKFFQKAQQATTEAANQALKAVAGFGKASAIQSTSLEQDYQTLKAKVMADCTNLKSYSLAKAEDSETTLRGYASQVSTVKKTAVTDYQKALEQATADLKSLNDA